MIELRNMHRIKATPRYDQRIKFKSSASGNTYIIGRNRKKKSQLVCSCLAWRFTHADCKHIKAVRQLAAD